MKTHILKLFLALALWNAALAAYAQGTAFTYQGQLREGSVLADGVYDFEFRVFDAASGGAQQGSAVSVNDLAFSNGLFTVTLDFGAGVFTGAPRWLDLGVRTNGGGAFTTLIPRQQLTPTPYALSARQVSEPIPGALLPANVLQTAFGNTVASSLSFSHPSNTFAGSFAGNGSSLSNLSPSSLRVGGVVDIGSARFEQIPITAVPNSSLSRPEQVAVGDFNGDGWPDVAELSSLGNGSILFVFTNDTRGDLGEFWSVLTNLPLTGQTLAAGDFNGDGRSDLFRANPSSNGVPSTSVALFLAHPVNRMTYAGAITTETQPYGLLVEDLNGDGRRDLVVANQGARTLQVFVNTAATLPILSSSYPLPPGREIQIASADLNGDGREDLVVASPGSFTYDQARLCLFTNSGGASFTAVTNFSPANLGEFYLEFTSLRCADVDGDGVPEILFSTYDPSGIAARILKRETIPYFTYQPWQRVPGQVAVTLLTQDFNSDGRPEIVSGDQLFGNDGRGNFGLDARLPGMVLGPTEVLATADFDKDGRNDIYVTGQGIGGSRKLLRNITGLTTRGTFTVQTGSGATRMVVDHNNTRFMGPSGATIMSLTENNGLPQVDFDPLASLNFGHYSRQMLNLQRDEIGIGTQPSVLYQRSSSRFLWYLGGRPSEFQEDPGIGGQTLMKLDANGLKVQGAMGLGTFAPQANLHVYSDNNPTVVRIQSAGTPGFGRLEFVSDPQGSGSEWRPGYIQSTDNGGFTGGLSLVVNGSGSANRFAEIEVMRIVNGAVGIGTTTPVSALQVIGTVTATAFNPPSDRNLKENFAPVSPREVLDKVAALPISRWNFKGDAATPHVGPMAQDFYAAFGTGTDERHIATVDADGVALAAIQGLNQKLQEELGSVRADNAELRQELAELRYLMNRLNQDLSESSRSSHGPPTR